MLYALIGLYLVAGFIIARLIEEAYSEKDEGFKIPLILLIALVFNKDCFKCTYANIWEKGGTRPTVELTCNKEECLFDQPQLSLVATSYAEGRCVARKCKHYKEKQGV
jgi:hypothetical protein